MATITKESIAEAAKLSNMSVNDYIDKLPDNYLQEAAKLSNIDIATYKTKLKEVWGDNAKKKEPTAPVGNGSGNSSSGNSSVPLQKENKPIIGTLDAQPKNNPYINVGINKPNASTQKEVKFVENKQKPIIGTKDAQQQKSIVSVDIPIKPLPTQEERDKALDKAKAEIELVKITNNFGNKKEDGTDDVAKNITDYYDTSIRQTAVNDLSKPDQLILQLSESIKAIKNEQGLIEQQYNSGKISENTYNTLNKNLEKSRTDLEIKTTGLVSERNKDIDNEIKSLKQTLLNGKKIETVETNAPIQNTMYGFSGGNAYTKERNLTEDEKVGIKKQISILEKQKGNISENLKMQDEEIEGLQKELQESQKQGLIPKGATLEQALKIQYARNDQTLKMLKEQSAKEGNPFVSSTEGLWNKSKEFVGDIIGAGTLKDGENPYLTAKNKTEYTPGYKNVARQYLVEDKTANKIYELQEQQKALSTIIELDRYGNYKKDSGFTNFTKQFTQTMIPTVKGKILTQSEIASATQQILNDAGINEVENVTGKVLNDNKHNVSDMLATTVAFGIQFGVTPNILGKFAMLGNLGMRYNSIRKLAETIEKGIKFTEKSKVGRLLGKMAETGLEYQGKGLLNAQLKKEATFGSGAFGVLGEKALTKMFPFGAGRWVSVIGRGWGELGEETGQQIWQTFANSGYHIDETIKDLKQQFPEMKDVQMFVFGTALMGMGFGVFSKSTGKDTNLSEDFEKWRENQIEKLKKEGKITTEELNQVNEVLREMADENRNAINNELKDGVDITEEEKDDLIKGAKEVKEQKGNDGNNITTIVDEQGNTMTIKDGKLYLLEEEDSNTENYTISDDGTVMHGARVIDNPNGLTEIELIKQDIESRKQQELIKANESGADTKDIEQRYNTELDNLEKNSIGSVQEQASTQTDSNSNKRDLQEQASTTPKDTQEITYSYNGETYIEDNKGNLTKEDHSLVPIDQQQEIKNNGQKIINVTLPSDSRISDVADNDTPKRQDKDSEKFGNDVTLLNTAEVRRPNGSIGTQGFTSENLVDLVSYLNNHLGLNIPKYLLSNKESIKGLIEFIKSNEIIKNKIIDYVKTDPIEVSFLPDGTVHFKDGNHRANLLNLIGSDVLPVIESGKGKKNTAFDSSIDIESEPKTGKQNDTATPQSDVSTTNIQQNSNIEDKKADIEKRRQEELESVSKVINQDDKKILEDNINKRFDLELQKINKENETTSTQPTDTGKKQNDGKGVQESQPNNNGVGTGNVQPTQTQTEQQRERKVIQADIKAVNNAIAELEGKKGVIAKANLEKQKAKLAELNKELADTEESNTTKNTTTTHPTKSSTKKETPKNNLQHSLDFDNLDGKLAQDEAEHRHAESKLTTEDNIEQEPSVKIVESQAESDRETELDTAKQGATKLIDNATGVQRKPLSEIHTDEKRFQGRDKLNEQVVNDIAENFSDADQDPVHVWTDPKDGKTYVLSGHHRYYGAKKAGRTDIKIQDRTGDFTEAQAIKFATEEANANRSMETPLERAKTLRKKREKGDSKEDIQKFLDKEGKNKNYVENLSHLNPNGKAIASLNALENSGDKVTQKETEKIADWIGEARKQNKKLSDQHENELFDFLMNKNSSKRITTKAELISKIASITGTLDFDPSKPLNIERYKYKSEGEKQYDKEVEERKDKISELQQKINDINDRFKNPNNPNYVSTDHKDYDSIKAQADKVIADTNVQLKAEQKALQELYQQKGKYTNAGSNQSALFQKGESNTETTPEQKKEAKSVISFLKKKFPNLFARGQKAFEEKVKQIMNPRFQALQNKLVNQYDFLFNGKPVAELTGKEFEAKEGVTLKQQVNDFFNFIGNKVNSTFGEVILDNRAYKDDSSHGQGREKVSAYKALPEILKNGMEVLPMGQHKADIKLKSGMIAAPITIDGKEYIAVAVVRQNKEGDNRLYVHEVTLKEKLLDSSSNPVLSETTQATNQGAIAKVLQNIVDAKNNPLKFMADYHGWHKAPRKEGKNSLDDMSDVFPGDLYSPKGFYYYADDKSSKADKESYKAIVAAKGKPNKKVKVYRAVPKGVTEINSGDWVTLSKEYAKKHGEHSLDDNYDIIETEVEANKLFNEGSINEFGIQFLKDKNGTIFGLYDPTENKIYLNERNLNPKTVWHEATHFQQAILKAMAQNGNKEAIKILAQFDKLLKPFVEQLLLGRTTVTIDGQRISLKADVYRKGANERTKAYKERMQDEVWAFLQQEENHKLWQKNDTPFKRAVNKFKEAVTNLFKSILDIPKHKDISNMTLAELVGHTAKQLQDGKLENIGKKEGEVRMMTMPDGTEKMVKLLPQVTNGFYSPIEKKLLDEKATNLSATKWLERLGKGDEMQFTGLKDFLESKKPNEQVKKSELQDFLRDNRIEVVEVVKGGEISEAEIDAFLEDEVWEGYTREEAREYLSNDETNEQTKYGQYQLAGERDNYKEVLVMMPNKHIEDAKRVSKGLMGKEWKQLNNAERIQLWDKINEINKRTKENNFKSSHFDEPNILVHLRMNSRTDAEGNKVLFLEEVQSDWGQTGKKDGFKTSENVWDTQLGKDAVAAIKDMDNLGFDSWQQAATAISKSKDPLNDFDINYEHKDLILKWRDAVNQERKTSIAPFVTDTNAWTKLGLKVALKEAVAQGADKIAWTTGEQQNERYDLSKQVDAIHPLINPDGTYDLEVYKDGKRITTYTNITENKIEDYVGKEIAKNIIEDAGVWKVVAKQENESIQLKKLSGKDLQVGGSGMKGFYGSPTESKLGIVGNVAKSLFKQEPKTIDVFQSDKLASGWSVTTKDINGNVQTNMFDSKSKGLAWLSKQEELEVLSEDAEGKNYTTQHSITITPEMREQAQEGQPLFMADTNGIYFSISNDGGQNLSDAEREEIRADLKTGLKLGNTIDELREMYAGTDEINISENDFSDLMSEAQKEFETEKSGKTTKIDDDTEKDNDIQDTPKENKKDNRKKTYEWHRVHEGKFPKELIENLEKYDLDHEVENQELAEKRVLAIIDNFGIENALKAVEKGYITGAEKAVVFSKAVEAIQAEIQLEIDPEIREKLAEDLGDIIRKTGDEMRDAGRFSAMWARIYKNSPLGYNAEYYINKYKESNNGEISKEMEDKFRELEETIKEQNAKIIELEKKQEEEIDKQIVESIVNNPPNKKDSKDKKSIKEKAKQLADKFRKFKTKPFTLKDADGNDIIIKQNSIVNYNDIIEAGAKIIEEAGRLGESIEMAIRKAREYVVSELEKQDWYKKLPQRDKDAVNTQLLEHFSIENTIESEYKISKGLLYELTKAGIERKGKDNYTIDDLVDDVYDIYKEQYPDLEKRQIRDDISNYGKTIDLSEEEIDVKLRNLRRDGKMLSAYEDLLNGNLPKRSGLQRDELTPSQREMQKKINDELRKVPKSAEQLKNAWKSALDAIKRKYQNQIEDLEKQIAKRERIVKILNRTELDDKANNLKARVEELKAELDELVGKKEMSEESKLRLVESNLKKSIEKTQDKIDYINKNGVEPKTPKNKSVTSNKIEALKEELKLKKEQLKLIREEKGLVEKKRLEMAKKRVAKQIDDLKERIANGDFSKKKRKPLPYDNELNDAKREKLKVQKEFEYLLYKNKMENRGTLENVGDVFYEIWNLSKSLKASVDYSAPLRQGSMLMFTNPIIFAKAWKKMYGYSFNETAFENAQLDIENHKEYVLTKESGLVLTSPNGELMAREESFMQRLPKRIPILKSLFSGSERAYTGFLNNLRFNVFLDGVDVLRSAGITFESDSKAYKDLAKYVNYATGRGGLGKLETSSQLLNSIFFSPRMITSRIQMVWLAINPNTNMEVRKMAFKSLLSFGLYIMSLGALYMLAFGDDDDKKNFRNFKNPTHTDFLKIKNGNYTYDMTSGYSVLIRTIVRFIKEEAETANGIKRLDGKGFGQKDAFSEIRSFFANKLAPTPSTLYKIKVNENPRVYGKKWDDTSAKDKIIDASLSLLAPITIEDMYENMTDNDIKLYQKISNILIGLHGISVNKYSNKPTSSKQNKMGGGNGFGGK